MNNNGYNSDAFSGIGMLNNLENGSPFSGTGMMTNYGNPALDTSAFDTLGNYGKNLDMGGAESGGGGLGSSIMGNLSGITQAGSGILNGILAMKQYGLAKDQFNFQKDAYNANYKNQVQSTNTFLEDRQRSRAASGDSNVMSVEDYMAANRVS